MKFITGAIIAALCSLSAEALKCYRCLNTRLIKECNTEHQLCPTNKTMCLTSVKTSGFSQDVTIPIAEDHMVSGGAESTYDDVQDIAIVWDVLNGPGDGLGIVKVTKKCSYRTECNADVRNIIVGGRKILCCSTDLCNIDSAAVSSTHCWLLLGGTAALTWTLLQLTISN